MDSIELTYHYRGKAQQISNNCIVEELSLLIFNVHTLFFLRRRSSPTPCCAHEPVLPVHTLQGPRLTKKSTYGPSHSGDPPGTESSSS